MGLSPPCAPLLSMSALQRRSQKSELAYAAECPTFTAQLPPTLLTLLVSKQTHPTYLAGEAELLVTQVLGAPGKVVEVPLVDLEGGKQLAGCVLVLKGEEMAGTDELVRRAACSLGQVVRAAPAGCVCQCSMT